MNQPISSMNRECEPKPSSLALIFGGCGAAQAPLFNHCWSHGPCAAVQLAVQMNQRWLIYNRVTQTRCVPAIQVEPSGNRSNLWLRLWKRLTLPVQYRQNLAHLGGCFPILPPCWRSAPAHLGGCGGTYSIDTDMPHLCAY